ncbi:mobilization protein, partial [Acinetobacter seifertii]
QLREWLHDSNGILDKDRITNPIIENHRRTTAAITGTTKAVEAATAEFRCNARQDYPSLVSTIKDNGERAEKLSANTKIISDNTEAISRART